MKTPNLFSAALRSPERDQWLQAYFEELQGLENINTFEATLAEDLPSDAVILRPRIVFKRKYVDGVLQRYKCRLTVDGSKMASDAAARYSPTPSMDSYRIALALAVQLDLHISVYDIPRAFTMAQPSSDSHVFVYPAPYMDKCDKHGRRLLYRILNSLYGMPTSSADFHRLCTSFLLSEFSARQSQTDPCVFFLSVNDNTAIIVLYVDDLLCLSRNPQDAEFIRSRLFERFNIRTERNDHIVGLSVDHDRTQGILHISHESMAADIVASAGLSDCRPVSTPLPPHTVTTKKDCPADEDRQELSQMASRYRSLVGKLMYLARFTRPDLLHAVTVLSRYCVNPGEPHNALLKHCIRYLRGTKDIGITFRRRPQLQLQGFSDSDYAMDIDSRKSTTGFVFQINGASVCFSSHLQRSVSLSTVEAELYACSVASATALFLRRVINEFADEGFLPQPTTPVTINVDNQGTISLIARTTNAASPKSRHIETRYFFVRDKVKDGLICFKYCPTKDNISDYLTKCLPRPQFQRLRDLSNGSANIELLHP